MVGEGWRRSFCVANRKFKAVRGTTAKEKLIGQQSQNSIHRIQCRPNKSPLSDKRFICRKNSPIIRSIKAFPEFLENVNKG